MQIKIGQQMITIMNMFKIFVQHTIKICYYHHTIHTFNINHTMYYCVRRFSNTLKPVNEQNLTMGLVQRLKLFNSRKG